jgi:hypothetical protein
MHLSDHDLKQIDESSLGRLSWAGLLGLAAKLLADLKESRDRLNRTPENSSQPPSTQKPWEKAGRREPEDDPEDALADLPERQPPEGHQAPVREAPEEMRAAHPVVADQTPPRRPGRQPGTPGVSRTQELPITAEQIHAPERCAACGAPLSAGAPSSAYTARYEIDVARSATGMPGLILTQTKHTYLESECACGHRTRAHPGRADAEDGWTVALTEWHFVGPMLVALICALWHVRLSRARIQLFLHDWLGLDLGVATINQCLHEAGRAVEPVVYGEILETVREAAVAYADETSWFEQGRLLWLWVFTCTTATLFVVGQRTKEVVEAILGKDFANWLMTDGYSVYREFDQRLRCLAHIVRKARGLVESLDQRASGFGTQVLETLDEVMEAIYQARAAPPEVPLKERFASRLDALFKACLRHANSGHAKTRALARELLNDWNTFWLVLEYIEFPLTNNEAERALRHWVIARRISYGTRTSQGTRAFALLASTVETCRKRSASPWLYLAEVLRQRRKGLPAPALPAVPAA